MWLSVSHALHSNGAVATTGFDATKELDVTTTGFDATKEYDDDRFVTTLICGVFLEG